MTSKPSYRDGFILRERIKRRERRVLGMELTKQAEKKQPER